MEVVALALGILFTCLIDTFWWHIDYKKAEKGLEWHEHYHVGLELVILSLVITQVSEFAAAFLIGAGLLFILAEWRQAVEVINRKVVAGHPFAYGSKHFKSSSIFGIILVVFMVLIHVYLPAIINIMSV